MKFLLVTTTQREIVKVWVCQETSSVGSLLPPVDLASVVSTIRQEGHEANVLDLRLVKNPLNYYTRELNRYLPDGVIMNLSTTSVKADYKILDNTPAEVKKICFGTHAQSFPDECFDRGVDYILAGDPETCIASLIKGGFNRGDSIGIWTMNSRDGFNYCSDLDNLPFPALDLLPMDRYYAPYIKRGNRFTLLLGSRGCPYLCTYCLYPVFFGDKYRTRTVKNVVDEIEYDIKKYNIKEFYFLDATFNLNEGRVNDISEEILKRGLKINWSCNMRVSPVSKEMLWNMKRAGCNRIFYGVEDQDFLKKTRKDINKEQTIEAFRETRGLGISTVAFLMLFPRDNIDMKSYEKNVLTVFKTLKADAFQCNIAIPFPGTKMYRDFRGKGILIDNWSFYDPQGNKLPYKSNIDLIRLKKNIYSKFLFLNPKAIIKIVKGLDIRALKSLLFTFIKLHLLSKR